MKLKFIECDKVNANGRMYLKKDVEKAIEDIQDTVSKKRFLIQRELTMSPEIDLEKVVALVEKVYLEDNIGYCEIKLLDLLSEERKSQLTYELEKGQLEVVSSCLGNIDEYGIVRNIKFNYLFLTTESAWN